MAPEKELGVLTATVPEKELWQSCRRDSGTCRTQSNYFAPTKQEGCQSPGLAEKQRIKRMVWKVNVSSRTVDLISDVKEWTGVHSSLVVSSP